MRPPAQRRRSIRLREYDYSSAGAYFVTICTHRRALLLGEVVDGELVLNSFGETVREEWLRSADIRAEIELDEFVVMPNHIHGIVFITGAGRGDRPVAPTPGPRPRSLSSLIAGFKSAATKRINDLRDTPGSPVWQRNYYERVIRDERELTRIREYIQQNPLQWRLDCENPSRTPDPAHDTDWAWLEAARPATAGRGD